MNLNTVELDLVRRAGQRSSKLDVTQLRPTRAESACVDRQWRSSRGRFALFLAGVLSLAAFPAFGQDVDSFSPHGGRNVGVTLNGTGFTGASSVSFDGTPASAFTVNSDTEIAATAPAAFTTGRVSVDAAQSPFNFISRTGTVTTVGPVSGSSLPLGAVVSYTGAPSDGSISRSGGQTFFFENLPLSSNTWLYWGAADGGVRLSMNGDDFVSPAGEVMAYSSGQSNLATGKLVYTGMSAMSLLAPWSPGSSVCTRFTMQFAPYNGSPLAQLVSASEAGLPAGIGTVAAIRPGESFSVNLLFEAAYASSGCTTWQPALVLYDAAPTNPTLQAWSSYSGGFFYENTAPEIGAIADQSVPDGGSTGDVGFSLSDAETGDVGTTLSVTSSNETLVPIANIAFGGSGNARTVSATAVAGETGSSLITVTATDSAGASSSESFTVSINNLPTISAISDVLVQFNQSSGNIAFTVGDVETLADNLVVTASSSNTVLVPNANIVFGGSGANRTINVQPFLSQTGSTTITVSVTDESAEAATSSFTFRVNAPPVLILNSPGAAQQGGSLLIDVNRLNATDAESGTASILYTLNPDGLGTVPYHGELRLNGSLLADGDGFSQADINSGLVVYQHDDSCSTLDQFTFNVNDSEGGITPLPPLPTSFSFNIAITLRDDAPTASNSMLSVGLGASVNGQLLGSDTDCLSGDVLSYSIVGGSGPNKGAISALNSATGTFTFTAANGESGADGFDFLVSDGTSSATGHVDIQIENQAPQGSDVSANTAQETAVSGTVVATDTDLPAQVLTFSIGTNAGKGVASIDANSGEFLYAPNAGRIGADSFTVLVSDGLASSNPITVTLQIAPRIDAGTLLTVAKTGGSPSSASVVVVDPVFGDQAIVASNGNLSEPTGIAADADGNIYVTDGDNGLLHISASTGVQTVLDGTIGFPVGVRIDPAGHLLVAEANNGVSVRNTDGSVIVSYSGGSLEFATDMGMGTDGYLYVSDAGAFAGPGSNKVVRIDPVTSAQQVVVGTGLVFPVSLVVDATGQLLVGDGVPGFGSPSSSVKVIDPSNGSMTTVSDALFAGITGIDFTESGQIYAANAGADSVLKLSISGGSQVEVSQGGYIQNGFGLAVAKRYGATITIDNPVAPIYDSNPHPVTISTVPAGVEGFVQVTYTPQAGGAAVTCAATDTGCGPVNAGAYDVSAVVTGTLNYSGAATGSLTIGKATGSVEWDTLSFVYDSSSPTVTAHITEEPASACSVSGIVGPDVGNYPVSASCTGSNYMASGSNTASVTAQPIAIAFSQLAQTYDGSPKVVIVTTSPVSGVPVVITYDGSTTAPTNANSYAVNATVTDPNYSGSANATLQINKAVGTVQWGTLSFVYNTSTHSVSASIADEPTSSCVVTGTVGPNVGSDPVSATCSGMNFDASGSNTASVTQATATVTLSHLTQAFDGSPKSVVVATTPAGLATSVTYNGNTVPPTAIGSYPVVATVNDQNYAGSAIANLEIVNGSGDIALILNGTVDPIHVGDLATYAATMIANPALHVDETFGYKVTLSKSGGNHPLDVSDIATMEIFYQGAWVDAEDEFGSIPFTIDIHGNLIYQFPDGVPGYDFGFPIQDPSWTWNVRFSFADTGTYTTTAELVDGVSKLPINPSVTASIATVVIAALPPTDIQLVLAGPAESVEIGTPVEYTGTMLADPLLHVGQNFFVKVTIAKANGTHALALTDLSAMQIFYGGSWQTLPPGEFSLVGGELVYVFPQTQMPGGFPIQDAEWSWNFRITYADTGTYTATAQVIDATDVGDPPYAFDTAAVSTTVVAASIVVPDMNLLLLGPVEDVVVGSPAEYTGTLLASPSVYAGQTFWVRVRLSKNGGSEQMTAADLEKMELYQGGSWQDATAALQSFLIQDGNDLVYLFPQPNGPFSIDAISWTWRFRFTYAGEGLYGAVADVIDAAEADPLLATSLANANTSTNVVAAIHASLTMAGDALGVVVRAGSIARPSSFSATTHLSGSSPSENVIAHLLINHSGAAQLSDLDIEYRAIAQESPSCVAASPSGYWCPLPLIQNGNGTLSSTFGPPTGFPFTDAATSYFRATFHRGGHFDVAVSIDGVDSATSYASASHTVNVAELNLQSAGSAAIGTGVTLDSTVTLANTGTSAISNASAAPNDENVIGEVSIARAGETLSPGELTVSYLAPDSNYYPITLQTCVSDTDKVCANFGPPGTGFPVAAGYNATSLFRTLFTLPGTYTVTTRALGVSSAAVFAVSSQTVVVTASSATITIDPASLGQTYNGGTHPVIVTTNPAGLSYSLTYAGNAAAPINAGNYGVLATITAPGYSGSASATLIVDKAVAGVVISNTNQVFDGSQKPVTIATTPSGLSTFVTYDSSATPPSAVGSYAVLATVADTNYLGSTDSTLHIVAGAAVTIAANGPLTFNGIAGEPLVGALPSVLVTDIGGNPVAGVSVTFATGAASGAVIGATQTTDSNGVATVVGWNLDATPGTDTVVASAVGIVATVEFTATSTTAGNALSVTISDGRAFAQFDRSLSYTITVNNDSNANIVGVAVSDVLPVELEVASALWQCIPLNGATCTATNSGDLIDTIDLPARSSVVYLLSAVTVRGPSDLVSNTITATGPDGSATDTDHTELVLFRNGFEIGGDGAQSIIGGFDVIGELTGTNNLNLDIRVAELGSLQVTTVARAADGSFRIEAVRIDHQIWLRLVAQSAEGERSSTWSPLSGEQAMLGLEGNQLLLTGSIADLSLQLDRDGAFTLEGALH